MCVCVCVCVLGLSRYMDATRGAIKKMRFGPGKGNKRLVMLYSTRLDIREIYEVHLVLLASTPKSAP